MDTRGPINLPRGIRNEVFVMSESELVQQIRETESSAWKALDNGMDELATQLAHELAQLQVLYGRMYD